MIEYIPVVVDVVVMAPPFTIHSDADSNMQNILDCACIGALGSAQKQNTFFALIVFPRAHVYSLHEGQTVIKQQPSCFYYVRMVGQF